MKDLIRRRIPLVLLVRHYDRHITLRAACRIPARSVVLVLSHSRVSIDAGVRGAPVDVPVRLDRVVEVAACEDGAVERVPRAAKGAFPRKSERGVGFEDVRVVDVHALK